MSLPDTVDFSVDFEGAQTGKKYEGTMTVRLKMSYRDRLQEDQIRRSLMGANPDAPDFLPDSIARNIAWLRVRLVPESIPAWFRGDWQAMPADDLVIEQVSMAAVEAVNGAMNAFAKETEDKKKAEIARLEAAADSKPA